MSLQAKVTITFIAVALLVTLLLGLIASVLLDRLFSQYLSATLNARQSDMKSTLEEHFAAVGSFTGAELYLRGNSMMMGGSSYIVADSDGVVVLGAAALQGSKLTSADIGRGIPLVVRGRRVGTLIANNMMGRMFDLAPLEQGFRQSFYRGLVVAGITVLLVSLALGIVVSRILISPLRQIDKAANTLASGELSYRLLENYQETELQSLVSSFNDMALKLEQNERVRRNLVADVAHELRTPVTILGASLESMLDGVQKPDEQQLASLYDEVTRMSRLIAELQDLSSAEAGKLRLKPTEFRLDQFVTRLIENLQALAEDRNITIKNEILSQINVVADYDRLTQVVYNILLNAIQHSLASSEVVVTSEKSEGVPTITIKDNGPGISAEDLPHIFNRFYRGDKSRQRGGSGLGLAIAKEFMQAMGGNITVTSVVGKGTTFTITVPLQNMSTN